MLNRWNNERGENLIELMVVLTVAILVIGSLVFSTISSLRNSQFSKDQVQATKYAQEGIEKVRSMRDRNGSFINFPAGAISPDPVVDNWSDPDLWNLSIKNRGQCATYCYFVISSDGQSIDWRNDPSSNPNTAENIGNQGKFFRYIRIEDEPTKYQSEKKVTVFVRWEDITGSHESKLTTILRKI